MDQNENPRGVPVYKVQGEFGRPLNKGAEYTVKDRLTEIEITANAEGFIHLAMQFLEMAKASKEIGADVWLPLEAGPFNMGDPMLILRKTSV